MPQLHLSPALCLFVNLLPSPKQRPKHKHKRKHKRPMNQQQQQVPQPHPQGLAEGQQAQWQPQFQQPMPGDQQPHPQYAQVPPDGAPMPMQDPTMSTPQVDAMYPQNPQMDEQFYGQQDPTQHAPAFPGHQQMPQGPQAFPQPPPHAQPGMPMPMPMGPEGAAEQYFHPAQQFQRQPGPPGAPGFVDAGFGPEGPEWEQANVTEVNNAAPPPGFDPAMRQQNQAIRAQQLFEARQRIEALEEERERREIQQALAISAMGAPADEELEEQFLKQIHDVQVESLENWERTLRRQYEGQG